MPPLWETRKRAAADGFSLIEGSCFAANPGRTANRADYGTMRDAILARVKAALPLEGVLLGLHGAMAAHGYDDAEGGVIERVRALVVPQCVIGVELDPHCHLTTKRVQPSGIIAPYYRVFPRAEVPPAPRTWLALVLRTVRGEIRPRMSRRTACRSPATDQAAADARIRRQNRGKGGPCRDAVRVHRPLLPLCRRPGTIGPRPVITDSGKDLASRLAATIPSGSRSPPASVSAPVRVHHSIALRRQNRPMIHVGSDGPLSRDYRKIPYTRVRRRVWPPDAETRPGLIA